MVMLSRGCTSGYLFLRISKYVEVCGQVCELGRSWTCGKGRLGVDRRECRISVNTIARVRMALHCQWFGKVGSLEGRNCFYAKGGSNLFQSPGPTAKMVSGQMPGYLPPTSKDLPIRNNMRAEWATRYCSLECGTGNLRWLYEQIWFIWQDRRCSSKQ